MTAKKFERALDRLGFTQSGFARHIGVSDRMVRNWIAGKWPVPVVVARLIDLMLDTNTNPDDLKG